MARVILVVSVHCNNCRSGLDPLSLALFCPFCGKEFENFLKVEKAIHYVNSKLELIKEGEPE